uniref:Uncharacterized protein n=1 Tax=Salarias fasciatus TaxID=181472 RepID=A0A672J2R1_SALFA
RAAMEDLCSGSGLDQPDLTQCFQQTIMVWSPCVYLWTCSPLYLIYLQLRPHRGVIPLSKLCCSKTVRGSRGFSGLCDLSVV